MDLAAYRRSAESFLNELTAEFYRHYAGLTDNYEIEPVYERHGELFTRAAVEELRELAAGAGEGSEPRRRLTLLLDFAVEGYLGQQTKAVEAELARLEAGMSVTVAGDELGFRESAVVQANEPDRDRRELIERARLDAVASTLQPLQRELIERQHAGAIELGWRSYREMCEECKSLDLAALHAQTERFLERSDERYAPAVEPELQRTLGFGFGEFRRSDLPRFFRASAHDVWFPADQLIASFVETLHGLGIDVLRQPGVTLDTEARPNKSPRAFCAPVRVPGDVHLVISPIGGRDDFEALFHEGGHLQHAAHVDPQLPFEFRYLGDNAITEAYAFLFQHLVDDPEWLGRRLRIPDASHLVSYGRANEFVYLRRYCAKLAYEFELHGPDSQNGLERHALRYASLLSDAVRVPWPRETFLDDVDPGFYCACYLRAWALETHLRAWLRERFGPAWFDSPEAGDALRKLWSQGQRMRPEQLLADLGGAELDFGVMLDELRI